MLTAKFEKGLPPTELTTLINAKFDRDFTTAAIYTKANKLGLGRRARFIVPKAPKRPLLITVLRFPVGNLLDRINAVVPRHLARDHRDDVIGEIALAVYEGRLEEVDIGRCVCEFVNSRYRRDHDRYGPLSLDAPIFADSTVTLGDTITTGLWQ